MQRICTPLLWAFGLTVMLLDLCSSPAYCLTADDIPADDKNRSLTSIPIPLPTPTGSEAKSMSQNQLDAISQTTFDLYAFQTTSFSRRKIKRAVIQLHGQGRDAWTYFDQTNEALYNATRSKTGSKSRKRTKLKRYETVIFAPWFLNQDDEGAYPVADDGEMSTSPVLVWNDGDWANGGDSILPSQVYDDENHSFPSPNISSFEALDQVIRHFSDKKRYPKMQTIIVAGHSMGAQMVQRYALIGAVPSGSVPVHFFIANPGSFAYLSSARPNTTEDCPDSFDEWKYGLGVYAQRYLSDFVSESLDESNDVTDVRRRYTEQRLTHYLFGTADHGQGDTRCEAMAQGNTHLTRGRNYMKHLDDVSGSSGSHTRTVDYIKGISHDPLGMFTSKKGIERLFLTNVEGEEEPQGVGDADADSQYFYPSSGPFTYTHSPISAYLFTPLVLLCIFSCLS